MQDILGFKDLEVCLWERSGIGAILDRKYNRSGAQTSISYEYSRL